MSESPFISVEQLQKEIEINLEVEHYNFDRAIEMMVENSRLFEFSVIVSDEPPRCLKNNNF